jgi:DNA uptake protein ComE-like DNA-binding protein
MSLQDFFYFTRREKQGLLLFTAFLAVFASGIFVGKRFFAPVAPLMAETVVVQEAAFTPAVAPPAVVAPPAAAPASPDTRQRPAEHRPVAEQKRTYYHSANSTQQTPQRPTYTPVKKYPAGTVIELNAADTAALMLIPGIGRFYARQITAYGQRLGGYCRLEQLQEVKNMYEELYAQITPYLRVDAQAIVPIPINQASLDRMRAHPYLSFYQARAIIEIRSKQGPLRSLDDLQLLEEFTADDRTRLAPYLAF